MSQTRKALAFLATLAALSPVLAQWVAPGTTFGAPSGMSYSQAMAYASVQTNTAAVRRAQGELNRINSLNRNNPSAQATARTQAQTAPQTRFRPGPQRLMVSGFVRSLSRDPATVREMTMAFNEAFKAFEAEAKRLGRPNNVAMAFTYLVGVCYMVYYGEEPSETALMNLQANTDAAFGRSAAFMALSAQDRQKLYETFVLMATLPLLGYTVAVQESDPKLLETYREIAGVALESALGVRPDRLKFTATGLELR
ncbi:DUF6683 family protein [Meiothermus sp.]|uniref:DUF6683 family protein n=1 Tax=Meiothermus sp. TaxID=1955249 RepID=UPI0021DDACE4|nr:DUF6683 family protein [Meiothermus sp.]GIW34850.1 MAG: hypothetical protein KatS3mg072_2183 [Meiothermus sp.]